MDKCRQAMSEAVAEYNATGIKNSFLLRVEHLASKSWK